jgi:hypothetical protein
VATTEQPEGIEVRIIGVEIIGVGIIGVEIMRAFSFVTTPPTGKMSVQVDWNRKEEDTDQNRDAPQGKQHL